MRKFGSVMGDLTRVKSVGYLRMVNDFIIFNILYYFR